MYVVPERLTIFHQSADLLVTGRSIPSTSHLDRNEDTMLNVPETQVVMVLDGSSGSKNGQLASRRGTIFLAEHLGVKGGSVSEVKKELKDALLGASEYIQEVAPGCRTTAVVVKLVDTKKGKVATFGHVGDSRGYVFQNNGLYQSTNDHNLVYASTIPPEEKDTISSQLDQMQTYTEKWELEKRDPRIAHFFETRNWVVQILGAERSILPRWEFPIPLQGNRKLEPRIRTVLLETENKLVLTSDGIHDNLTLSQMEHVIATSKRLNLGISLVRMASQVAKNWKNLRATEDDMTAIVISLI